MIPYWLLFAVVLYGAVNPLRMRASQGLVIWIITGLGIALMIGLRHKIGGDWDTYFYQFDWVAKMSFSDAVSQTKDPAYYPLGWLIAHAGGSIYLLNLVCAALLVAGTLTLAKRQPRPWLALLSAVPYLFIVVGMGYTRQAAALGCAMIGLVALGDGKLRTFVIWILIGAAFHKSAVLLIPIATLASTKNRVWSFIWVSAIAAVGYWLFIQSSSDILWDNYVESDYADASQGAAIRVTMNAIPAIIMLLYGRRLSEDMQIRRLWSLIAIAALLCIPLLPLSATAVDRMALYFIPLQLFVFGRITRLASTTSGRTHLVAGVIAYYAAVQFVWLNFAGHVHAWVPYQSILFQ